MENPLASRRAGLILHPTSLPGPQDCGSLGEHAFRWIDFLQQSGFGIWQFLPLTPVSDGSPYNSYSAFAGNCNLIDIRQLETLGFPAVAPTAQSKDFVLTALQQQFQWFESHKPQPLWDQFLSFCASHSWLDDYCLFVVLKEHYPTHWADWPETFRDRQPEAMLAFSSANAGRLQFHRFAQFIFITQWLALREYARARNIVLFGDIPIFVAHDSVDVWSHRHLFKLDSTGQPQVVAGVPPDYFSATGQRWGNPLYDWPRHQDDGYHWWQKRIDHALSLYDTVRIDHFRGFLAGWEIPADEETAINGHWVEAPGNDLLQHLLGQREHLPLIAEDLGIITPDVIALREKFALPGMKILQFAFDSDGANPYLPHNHSLDSVVYTGTHDNDTTLGWYATLSPEIRERIANYYAKPQEAMPWPLIRSALASPARWTILPLQDVLELDGKHRMNTPGTTSGNWAWRFDWDQFKPDLTQRLQAMVQLYHRS